MANPEHLNQLRSGSWNEWRAAHPTLAPDLIDAQLAGADLRGLNLTKAHLRSAELSGARLDGADLSHAILEGSRLKNAVFQGAVLDNVQLDFLDLSDLDLSKASLQRATLRGTNLTRTDDAVGRSCSMASGAGRIGRRRCRGGPARTRAAGSDRRGDRPDAGLSDLAARDAGTIGPRRIRHDRDHVARPARPVCVDGRAAAGVPALGVASFSRDRTDCSAARQLGTTTLRTTG